mgnify:CR=1 FL=1
MKPVGGHDEVFRGRETKEDAYIIKVRENGVVVLVPRYGIEGIVYVCERGARNPFAFDEKAEALTAPGCSLRVFDKVTVLIKVDAAKAHRPKLSLEIVEPTLPKT